MKIEQQELTLPEGRFAVNVGVFDDADDAVLRTIYNDWRTLSKNLRALGGRGVNLPEVLSESVFCRAMNTVRLTESIPGANTSFDVYNLKTGKRIQVKACSVLPDLTSFGPKSVWDEIYFCDFFREGNWDGSLDIYKIPNHLIYNHKVNANQTFREQQAQGRRPRFSIYTSIITAMDIKPIMTYNI